MVFLFTHINFYYNQLILISTHYGHVFYCNNTICLFGVFNCICGALLRSITSSKTQPCGAHDRILSLIKQQTAFSAALEHKMGPRKCETIVGNSDSVFRASKVSGRSQDMECAQHIQKSPFKHTKQLLLQHWSPGLTKTNLDKS